jgi:hypothetical protein
MWQTKFYTHYELTSICRTLAAASSSSLESVFGSFQLHTAVIDTLPEEGIKFNVYCTSLTVDKRKILLNLRNRRFLPNSFLLFLFSCFHFLGLNADSSFRNSVVFNSTNYSLSHLPFAAVHGIFLRASKSKYFFLYSLLLVITKISNWCEIRAATWWSCPKVRLRLLDVQVLNQHKQTSNMNWW